MDFHFTVDGRGSDADSLSRRRCGSRTLNPGSVSDASQTGRVIERADEGHPDA